MITSDYVPKELITVVNPTVVANTNESWTYNAYWTYSTIPSSLCSYTRENINLSKMYTLNNNYANSRAISSLLYTEYWKNFVNSTYADIAIGSPTVEMFVEGWNSNVIGRNLCWHTLSISTPNQYGRWLTLASPSNYDGTEKNEGEDWILTAVSYYCTVGYIVWFDADNAFRPIVRIKNSMTGTYNGDSWTLR